MSGPKPDVLPLDDAPAKLPIRVRSRRCCAVGGLSRIKIRFDPARRLRLALAPFSTILPPHRSVVVDSVSALQTPLSYCLAGLGVCCADSFVRLARWTRGLLCMLHCPVAGPERCLIYRLPVRPVPWLCWADSLGGCAHCCCARVDLISDESA